jgi:hypothetical protein
MSKLKYCLTNAFESNGYWWLPENKENKVPGKISFDPLGDFSLNLLGTLGPEKSFGGESTFKPEIIQGVLEDGQLCTLINSFQTNYSFGTILTNSTFALNIAIIGWAFDKIEAIKFNCANFELTNLNNWASQKCFKTAPWKDNKYCVEYNMPKKMKFSINSLNSTLSICSRADIKPGFFSNEIYHQNYIQIRPKKKQNLDWFLEAIYGLQNLIAILTAERIFTTQIKLGVKKEKGRLPSGKMNNKYASILLRQSHYEQTKDIHSLEIPFTFRSVMNTFGTIVDSWFEEKLSNSSIYDVFFHGLYNKSLNQEFEFIGLMQSLEGIHRALGNDKYMDEQDYEEVRKTISNSIPVNLAGDHKDALKARIKYGNEYSLRKRMSLIFQGLDGEIRNLITDDYKQFISKVVDNRNYLTHYDKASAANKMEWHEMYLHSWGLRTLLICLIYKKIGINSKTLVNVLKNNRKFTKPTIS